MGQNNRDCGTLLILRTCFNVNVCKWAVNGQYIIQSLLFAFIIVDGERRGVVGQVGDVALQRPVLTVDTRVDFRHVVRSRCVPLALIVRVEIGGRRGIRLELALRELVALPQILAVLVDGLSL